MSEVTNIRICNVEKFNLKQIFETVPRICMGFKSNKISTIISMTLWKESLSSLKVHCKLLLSLRNKADNKTKSSICFNGLCKMDSNSYSSSTLKMHSKNNVSKQNIKVAHKTSLSISDKLFVFYIIILY